MRVVLTLYESYGSLSYGYIMFFSSVESYGYTTHMKVFISPYGRF